MSDNKDYRKLIGNRFMAAHRFENVGKDMTLEQFERLILISEFKKDMMRKRKERFRLRVTAACVAMFIMLGGMTVGVNLAVNANADKDRERNVVKQGDNKVIGNGVTQDDGNIDTITNMYTAYEDIPDDIKSEVHFLDVNGLTFVKTKITQNENEKLIVTSYIDSDKCKIEVWEIYFASEDVFLEILKNAEESFEYGGITIISLKCDESRIYNFEKDDIIFNISIPNESEIKKETILDGLLG